MADTDHRRLGTDALTFTSRCPPQCPNRLRWTKRFQI